MIDFRPLALVIGLLLIVLAATMLIPAAADSVSGNTDWQVFLASAGVTVFVGVSLVLSSRSGGMTLSLRQAFLMATLVWVTLPVFAAFPFVFSELNLSYTDAFFEAMSGITTTGSTVISNLDKAPPGILLWRGILQLLGGLGIIVMAINVLPMLQIGGMQMFRAEAFEAEDKTLPRMAQVAGGITMIYIALTAIWAGALWLAGMTGLDAAVHAMTTIATGGYSNWDDSIGHFDSALIDAIVTAGMIVGGIPFLLYLKGLHGNPRALLQDQQVRWYLSLLFVAVVAVADWLIVVNDMSVLQAFRYASFNVVSIMTGTGYSSTDFTLWGTFPVGLLFFLMFVGGCAGSTTCGIKVFRFQILYEVTSAQVRQLIHPHGVFVPRYNARPIERRIVTSVLSFFFLFGACFALLSVLLSLLGLDFITAVSSAASALANVGPGLGEIVGPAGNFQSLPSAAKWMLAAGMLVGRLELFTVFVLLSPRFWRG